MQGSTATVMVEAERSGAEIVCEILKANGVDVVFGYGGGAILPFYDALHRESALRHVMVRHEQGAAHAAAGYARASGRVGVCVATSGPGATNLVTGIMDAHLDSIPLVALAGQVATPLIGRDAFQETDMLSITASITKHAFQPRSADEIAESLAAAFEIACSGRPGPVFVDLPNDALIETSAAGIPRGCSPLRAEPGIEQQAAIERAARLLARAARPLLLLGGGAVSSGAGAEVRTLAENLGLPVVTTITAKGLFPESHPQALGMIGMYGRKSGIWALREADLILALGCRFTDRITGRAEAFARGKKVIQVDIDRYEIGKNVPVAVGVRADIRWAAAALDRATRGFRVGPQRLRWARQAGVAREICEQCVPHLASGGVHPKRVMDELNRVRCADDLVTTGVGQHQMFACHFLEFDQPRRLLTSAGAGTMGYGLPAAIGAAQACPGARVFVVDGDGSFQMTCQELATAVQEGLRIIVLVLDNGQLGMVRQWQDRQYEGRWEAISFEEGAGRPDFVALARSFGVHAIGVAEERELASALDDAVGRSGPVLLHIRIDPEVNNAPMMPAGHTFADFYGNCVRQPGQLFDREEVKRMAGEGGSQS